MGAVEHLSTKMYQGDQPERVRVPVNPNEARCQGGEIPLGTGEPLVDQLPGFASLIPPFRSTFLIVCLTRVQVGP